MGPLTPRPRRSDATGARLCESVGLRNVDAPSPLKHSRRRHGILTFGRRCPIKHLIHLSTAFAVFALASTLPAEESGEDTTQNKHSQITEAEVVDTIKRMFHSFSVESDDRNNFYDVVTDDFVLYEMGQIFSASEFIEFAESFNTIEDDWELTDFNISIDNQSAHAYFKNKGRFVTLTEGKKRLTRKEWLESAYIVRVNGELRVKFYFSDAVNESSEELGD